MYNVWYITIALGIVCFGLLSYSIYKELKEDDSSASMLTSFFLVAFCFVLLISIYQPWQAKKEFNEFIETKTMIEMVYSGDYKDLENTGLNNSIIEANKWLVRARVDKQQRGNWSMYCYLDLDGLDYIQLVKGDNG